LSEGEGCRKAIHAVAANLNPTGAEMTHRNASMKLVSQSPTSMKAFRLFMAITVLALVASPSFSQTPAPPHAKTTPAKVAPPKAKPAAVASAKAAPAKPGPKKAPLTKVALAKSTPARAALTKASPTTTATATATKAGPSSAVAESSPVEHLAATTGPININRKLKKLNGKFNLLVSADGTYAFSGEFPDKKPGLDWDITVGLRSNLGAVILFDYVGNAANGVEFSKQGQSGVLKDNFASFSGPHDITWNYCFHLSSQGREKRYREEERKREELRREEEEARKRHDEKLAAQKREEQKKLAQQELAQERGAAQSQQASNGGSGSGFDSTVSGIVSDVSSAAKTIVGLGSDFSSVLSMF
jgi:hypothetical protein